MIIGVLKEIKANEYRVAATPDAVREIKAHGHEVLVQSGAGKGSGFSDEEYAAAGAEICSSAEEVYRRADLFYKVKEIFPEEFKFLGPDKIIGLSTHSPAQAEAAVAAQQQAAGSTAGQ